MFLRRRALVLIAVLVLIGVLFVGVFPIRTYLSQRQALNATEKRLHVLNDQDRELAARVTQLQSNEEIERLAREQYNLVKPGEEAYAILPPPATAQTNSQIAATKEHSVSKRSTLSRVWNDIRFWN